MRKRGEGTVCIRVKQRHILRTILMEIGLISCTKSKRDQSAQPQELYMESPLFRKARAYAERVHDEWYIHSAKHHLREPDGPPIAPDEETLTTAGINQRRKWAQTVYDRLTTNALLQPGRPSSSRWEGLLTVAPPPRN